MTTHITTNASALLAALQHGVHDRRSTLPAYACAKITDSNAGIRLQTTDGSQWLSEFVDGRMEGDAICANAQELTTALKGLSGEVTLETEERKSYGAESTRVILRQGRRRYTIDALPAHEFPSRDEATGEALSVDSRELSRAIGQVEYAMAKSDVRYYLNGVQIHPEWVAATDGHRMARVLISTGLSKDLIVPAAAVRGLRNWLLLDGAELLLEATESGTPLALRVRGIGFDWRTSLTDGNYPDIQRVIPKHNDTEVQLDGPAATAAVERLNQMIAYHSKYGGMSLRSEGGELVMAGRGAHHDEIGIEAVAAEGELAEEIGVNARYLQDALKAAGQTATLAQKDASTAMLITGESGQGEHVVMPMRL